MCAWVGLHCSSSIFCCCDKHYDQKLLGEERVNFILEFMLRHEGKSGQELRNLEARTESVSMEEYYLHACSICCLIQPRTTCLRDASSHNGPGPPVAICNQENARQTCLQANMMKAFSQMRFPLPRWWWVDQKITGTGLNCLNRDLTIGLKEKDLFLSHIGSVLVWVLLLWRDIML
jgi:hypothetical protein